jgi:hypothetical protein
VAPLGTSSSGTSSSGLTFEILEREYIARVREQRRWGVATSAPVRCEVVISGIDALVTVL